MIFLSVLVVITSVSITPTNPTGIAGDSNFTLTCAVNLSGPGTPNITWSGPLLRGPVIPEVVQTSYTVSTEVVRVSQSYAGVYICQASIGASTMRDTVTVSVTAPTISVLITESQTPSALRRYSLMCVATAPSTLALTTISCTWRRYGVVQSGGTSCQLSFSSLPLSEDNVPYKCHYRASSVYLNNNVVVTSSVHTIRITIAPVTSAPSNITSTPQTKSVRLTWFQSSLDVVDNYIISYRRIAGCKASSGSKTINGSLRTYTLTGLEETITYEITITATNTNNNKSSITNTTTLSADTSAMTTQAIPPVKVNSGACISTVVVSVAASVIIFTLVLIIFILMIYISRLRKTRCRCTPTDAIKNYNAMDDIHKYDTTMKKGEIQGALVTPQATRKTEVMDMINCVAYGEINKTSDYNNDKQQHDQVLGVYETIQ